MPALNRFVRRPWLVPTIIVAVLGPAPWVLPSCKPKISAAQCDALIDHYATLVVTETLPDAGPDRIKMEQERERTEARGDDAFKNCSSEVSHAEFDCAMHAATATAFEKCLE